MLIIRYEIRHLGQSHTSVATREQARNFLRTADTREVHREHGFRLWVRWDDHGNNTTLRAFVSVAP